MVQGVPAVYFNLSHSGDYIVCAVSDQEVGIDIQQMGKGRLSLAERYFHPNEVVQLKQATTEEQGLLFYRYWAAKESFLKYIGTGLSGSLSAFEILFTEETIRVKNNKLLQEPHLWSIEIAPNYQCCLCATSAERPECSPFYF